MKKTVPLPSAERLRDILDYDPDTGILTFKIAVRRKRGNRMIMGQPGDVAGSRISSGHLMVFFHGEGYLAHRLIWVMMTGEDPGPMEIDHKNGVRSQNNWDNLRPVDYSQQRFNHKRRSNNTTGHIGVTVWRTGGFRATIKARGKFHSLGYYKILEEAVAARKAGELKYHGEHAIGER